MKERETNRQRAKKEAQAAKNRRTMTRRAFLGGGLGIAGLAAGGWLLTQANTGETPVPQISDPIINKENPLSEVEMQGITRQAIADYESVFGVNLDESLILANTAMESYDKIAIGKDRAGGELFSAAETSGDIPPKMRISTEFIQALSPNDQVPMTHALLVHELVHYDGARYSDPDLSRFLFSQYDETRDKGFEGEYIRGFKVVGKSTATGQDFSIFNQLEEAAAFTLGNYAAQKKGILPVDHFFFSQQGFSKETESFSYVVSQLFPNFGEGLNTVAALRRSPGGLSQFAQLIGQKLGWTEVEAQNIGMMVLSHVNSGSIENIKQGFQK